jgi:hypothetical protein
MTTADDRVDRLADKLQEFANRSASDGGLKEKAAQPLADDAAFLRGLKPSEIKARAKGGAPTDEKPRSGAVTPAPQRGERPPAEAEPTPKPKSKKPGGGDGPNPWVIIGLCFVAGIALAKWIDWRGHAHPRY